MTTDIDSTLDGFLALAERRELQRLDGAWRLYREGCDLLFDHSGELDETALRRLAAAVLFQRDRLCDLAADDPGAAAALMEAALGEVEDRTRQLLSSLEGDPVDRARAALRLRERVQEVQPVLEAVDPDRGPDPDGDLERQIDFLDSLIRPLATGRAGRKTARELLGGLDDARSRARANRAETFLAGPTPEGTDGTVARALWRRRERSSTLVSGLEGSSRGRTSEDAARAREALGRLATHRAELTARIREVLARLPPTEALAIKREWAAAELENAGEVLTQAEELPLAAAVEELADARDRIVLVRDLEPPLENRELVRLLEKVRKKLHNEWVEKEITSRLENRFGRTFVALLENTVLALILAVCGMLVVESVVDLSIPAQYWMIWIDAGICAVFLFEFFLKTLTSPDRGNYARRHWFTDLLPSIPFGLVLLFFGLTPEVIAAGAAGAAVAGGADNLRVLRAVRFARLPRLIRYVRIARPLIRVLRVMIFALRAMDRLVSRNAALLNRNIVFFSAARPTAGSATIRRRFEEARARAHTALRATLARLDDEARFSLLAGRVAQAGARAACTGTASLVRERPRASGGRDVRVEEVVETLLAMNPAGIEEKLGGDTNRKLARILRMLQVWPLSRLPVLGPLVAGARSRDDAVVTTGFANALGRRLEKLLTGFYWLFDFFGILSGPQMVDRAGVFIERMTGRPAKRLLMFGGVFVLLMGIVHLMPVPFLQRLSERLTGLLGVPIIVIGVVCLVLLLFGKWLQKIGGAATEFYERTGEAQFLGLLGEVKTRHTSRDFERLTQRVIAPEVIVRGRDPMELARTDRVEPRQRILEVIGAGEPDAEELATRIWLLYRDYQTGPILHRKSNRTTNQFLGNLVLRNLRSERLRMNEEELGAIEVLDLERPKTLFGPYLWFGLITNALAQRTARLIVEYNRNCIPVHELGARSAEERAEFARWLEMRSPGSGQPDDGQIAGSLEEVIGGTYRTTTFTALDFLDHDPERLALVRRRYGDRVAEALVADRRDLVREVFGTFPGHQLPREQRIFNPYSLYWQFVGGGRVLVLPLRIGWLATRGAWWLLRRFARTIREILNPTLEKPAVQVHCGFDVALRKIARMREPILMETTRLRARFDVESLGLQVPGCEGVDSGVASFACDLEFVGATDEVFERFRNLVGPARDAMAVLKEYLVRRGLEEEALRERLQAIDAHLAGRAREVLRALASAFLIDYRNIRTLAAARGEIERARAASADASGSLPEGCRLPGWFSRLRAPGRALLRAVGVVWGRIGDGRPAAERRAFRRWCLADVRGVAAYVLAAASVGDPDAAADEVALGIMRHPQAWSEQLVTLRTVQTLAVLDIETERDLVGTVGMYDEVAPHR